MCLVRDALLKLKVYRDRIDFNTSLFQLLLQNVHPTLGLQLDSLRRLPHPCNLGSKDQIFNTDLTGALTSFF